MNNIVVEKDCDDYPEGKIPDPLKENLIRRMNRIEGKSRESEA